MLLIVFINKVIQPLAATCENLASPNPDPLNPVRFCIGSPAFALRLLPLSSVLTWTGYEFGWVLLLCLPSL